MTPDSAALAEHAEFEAWARGPDGVPIDCHYAGWAAWQARAALLWISVDERMPEHGQSVALVNANRWENTGGDFERNVHAAGYWNNWGGGHWSVRGERAISRESFTHWMPLPAPPAGQQAGGA